MRSIEEMTFSAPPRIRKRERLHIFIQFQEGRSISSIAIGHDLPTERIENIIREFAWPKQKRKGESR